MCEWGLIHLLQNLVWGSAMRMPPPRAPAQECFLDDQETGELSKPALKQASVLEGQGCAKPLMLSRNENANNETPKGNVFHMHRLAHSEGMQMQGEAGWGSESQAVLAF